MTNTVNSWNKKIKIGDWDVFQYEIVNSTNEEIKRLYDESISKKLIVVSNEQNQGKGRLKRKWISPKNSGLYASWLLYNYEGEIGILPFLAGIACIKCLEKYSREQFFLKWPNDLIVKNKKLGGILIEKYKDSVIIGIGINLIYDQNFPATSVSLDMLNVSRDFKLLRDELLEKLVFEIDNTLKFENKHILEKARKYLTTQKGELIQFIKDNVIFNGKVVGLSGNGSLSVELENKKIVSLNSEEFSIKK